MKYFIDTEFIEGFHKPLFGKARHFIDLISIGIVAEDGREYYAISSEYDYKKADQWVIENVLLKMYQQQSPAIKQFTDIETFHKRMGKPNDVIAKEIMAFVNPPSGEGSLNNKSWNTHLNKYNTVAAENRPVEFYGYYADYDWVLFCSLFGRMINLPEGFPMHCKDLKQMYDEKNKWWKIKVNRDKNTIELKDTIDYPKQKNEHNALADAKWNFELYKFLNTL